MRVVLAGIGHETNTYAVDALGPTDIDQFAISRGDEITRRNLGTRTYYGGMLDAIAEIGATAVPLYDGYAYPSGTITAEAYQTMKAELLAMLSSAQPVDAVALSLHGAGVASGTDDLEGDLVSAIRGVVGPDVPVVAVFDLHGNASDEMASALDLTFPCRLYPHEDMYERGHEMVSLVPALLSGELRPQTHVEHLPMLMPTSTTDEGNPAHAMNVLCRDVIDRAGIVDCAVFHGFPYTDVPLVGVHVVATAHDDLEPARAAAREVAAWIWEHRDDFRKESIGSDEAVHRALAEPGRPVVINETSDNPGGGTPGDGTHLLRAMIDAGLDDACFAFICDPEVVETALQAGIGASISVELGGKHDDLHGKPIALDAYVKAASDGRFVLQQMGAGMRVDFGPMVRLQAGGIDIIVGSKPSQTFDPEVFLLHGIDVSRYKVVGLKSSQHFRAGFRDVAAAIITADAPGLTTLRPEVFERFRAAGPLWPQDADAVYPA